ncbi:MAG: ATP-binding protein [Nanoarchaeota archaeon]|nr:ATP-binding protein [Nanoarchaeota archaeon]
MEASEHIERFQEFFESYKEELHEIALNDLRSIHINFSDISKFDPELSEELLNEPEEILKAAEVTIANMELPSTNIRVRIINLPKSKLFKIRDIRSIHINKFLNLEGIVRQTSDVRPHVVSAMFECPSCGSHITMLQLESKFKEPSRCSCGRRGKFRLLSKDLVDAQRIIIEEPPENLDGGEQPKRLAVFLKEDLVEPKMEKRTTPGSKVSVVGTVKEVVIPLSTGGQSTRYDLIMECNSIVPMEETFEDIKISKKDEKEIQELAKDNNIYQKLTSSIAPSIYGHEIVKEAIVLQLMGGVKKLRPDGTRTRGDMHILLVGDPGCISGDSQVALIHKGMEPIKNLGKKHMQPIREAVTKIRENGNDKYYDYATVFQHYTKQPVLKVITETGKEITCTYNQPFLTKYGWERADELLVGDKLRVMPKIPTAVKKLADTGFTRVKKKYGPLKKINLPKKVTPELASLYGLIIGDGCIHPRGYTVTCYVNDEEQDLIEKISELWKETFNVEVSILTKAGEHVKTIDDGNGLLREFISKQTMYCLEVNSKQIAYSLSFLANKRVPQEIFRSPTHVIAKFIGWLFDADGCAFGNGRGKTAIQLKSRTEGLLRDVQLLLLYFGIHSRIIEDNLCIRRSHDIELFAKYIGFNCEKKKATLKNVLEKIKNKNDIQKRKKFQRWEKVSKIVHWGVEDVYDFKVPKSKRFIANGIVCHNSGKSQLLQFVSKAAPKARYLSGKGVTSAGMTASVIKDEFLRGWALEAGALVLANMGIACLDEMDKISEEDTSSLHEAMEQQTVTISKANIQATLRTETTVLAAANPKFGRFDPYTPIAGQIDMPPTLINRFDLIFPIRDIPDREKDEKIASHVLEIQRDPKQLKSEIPIVMMKKYIAYVKQRVFPKLTKEAIEEIKDFYVGLRNLPTIGDDISVKPIPISARQLEALVRLAEGSARVRLSKIVTKKDTQRAITILKYCLMQVGFDYETGQIDIDRISTGITASERGKILSVREIINELDKKVGKEIPIEDILAEAAEKGINEDKVNESIEKLKRSGEIFQPKQNFISKI